MVHAVMSSVKTLVNNGDFVFVKCDQVRMVCVLIIDDYIFILAYSRLDTAF